LLRLIAVLLPVSNQWLVFVLVSENVSRYAPVSGRNQHSSGGLLRRFLGASAAIAFTAGAVWAVSGILARQAPLEAAVAAPDLQARMSLSEFRAPKIASLGQNPFVISSEDVMADRFAGGAAAHNSATQAAALSARFDEIARKAALSRQKLASVFGKVAKPVFRTARSRPADLRDPSPERFAIHKDQSVPYALAYADPSPLAPAGALAALSVAAPTEEEENLMSLNAPLLDDLAGDHEDTPDSAPLPGRRPKFEAATKPGPRADELDKPSRQALEEAAKPGRQAADSDNKPGKLEKPRTRLSLAKPDGSTDEKPRGGSLFGNWLGNGGSAKARNGVAVYDISAARVYMPDGSVLEAHSGIGDMADNPRYVKHRMKGPTPPHTYNLRMRERRFHGVEAIRMLPVDGKNKYGRDGFLTHSYLLRGGRAESHGCVAFKDYNKFLNAFKKGKIQQLVVVPGGGRAAGMKVAQNGRGA
jgi:hypothetical protein